MRTAAGSVYSTVRATSAPRLNPTMDTFVSKSNFTRAYGANSGVP
jgi:hypothetical protein